MAKKSYFIIFILFVIILGIVFFMGKSNKVEAPTGDDVLDVDSEGNSMPIIPEGNDVSSPEMSASSEGIIAQDGVREFIISGINFAFSPNVINVKKGEKVRIIFENTVGFHDLKIDEYGVATKQAKAPYQEILEFTANKAGTFEYYCSVDTHRAMGMFGTLNVN